MTIDITAFRDLVGVEHGLAVVAIATPDRSVHTSVANAGVLDLLHSGGTVVGLVVGGESRKLTLLRDHPRATVVLRAGFKWAAVEGTARLIGPDDPSPDYDAEGIRLLLREIFTAAGGTHDDWDTYDRTMAEQRRTAVLITPEHLYTNPTAPEEDPA